MKLASLFFAIIYCGLLFSQEPLQPYVHSKTEGFQKYESVKVGFFNSLKGVSKEGVKTKVKSRDLVSALVGKNEDYKSYKHRQVVAFGIKSEKLLSRKGTKIDGKTLFEVIMKNGDNMLVSNQVSRGYWTNSYTGTNSLGAVGAMGPSQSFNSGGSSKQYYFVKGSEVTSLMVTEFFNDEFIEEMISTFGNCSGIESLLSSYKDKKGKLFKLHALFKDLKQVYLEKCFEK